MRTFALAVLLALAGGSADAGPVADQFKAGALGIPWNTPLDDVVGMLPGGRYVFVAAPMCRGYVVADGQALFGVPRDGYTVMYVFDGFNKLRAIVFDLPPERRDQMFGALYSLMGQPSTTQSRMATKTTGWPRDNGVNFGILETIGSKFPLVWVKFEAPPTGQPVPTC